MAEQTNKPSWDEADQRMEKWLDRIVMTRSKEYELDADNNSECILQKLSRQRMKFLCFNVSRAMAAEMGAWRDIDGEEEAPFSEETRRTVVEFLTAYLNTRVDIISDPLG
jgi:hypothetical protein